MQRLYQRLHNIQTDYQNKIVATVVRTKPQYVSSVADFQVMQSLFINQKELERKIINNPDSVLINDALAQLIAQFDTDRQLQPVGVISGKGYRAVLQRAPDKAIYLTSVTSSPRGTLDGTIYVLEQRPLPKLKQVRYHLKGNDHAGL